MIYFVFGSNEGGRHGAGAALYALKHCHARQLQGFGPHGFSFAIPTKDWDLNVLPVVVIWHYVDRFLAYARKHAEHEFKVTAIGTGLAGYPHADMAKLFYGAPTNCKFDERWRAYLGDAYTYFEEDA